MNNGITGVLIWFIGVRSILTLPVEVRYKAVGIIEFRV